MADIPETIFLMVKIVFVCCGLKAGVGERGAEMEYELDRLSARLLMVASDLPRFCVCALLDRRSKTERTCVLFALLAADGKAYWLFM